MSKRRAPKQTKDCHNCFRLGMCAWTESESEYDSQTAEAAKGPSAEVHCHSLAPENFGSSKKKWKLSLIKPKVLPFTNTQSKTINIWRSFVCLGALRFDILDLESLQYQRC